MLINVDTVAARLARRVLCDLAVYLPDAQFYPVRLIIRALKGI